MDTVKTTITGGAGVSVAHESAYKHVTGQARYVDDIAVPANCLHACFGLSSHAHAELLQIDTSALEENPDVIRVFTAADIPGRNDVSPMAGDDPLLADGVVEYVGQPVFAVIATSRQAAIDACRAVQVEYSPLPALIEIDDALAAKSYVLPPKTMERGNASEAIASSAHRLEGELRIGGQEHFYLESQAALALPGEDDDVTVYSSTQHPSEAQHIIAHVLGSPSHSVTVKVRRMGGAFGGKETQGAGFAAMAALAAKTLHHPVKIVPDRDADMQITGKRHDFLVRYEVGYDDSGQIEGLNVQLASRCGRSADLSGPVNDRAMFHVDNCCYLPHVRIHSLRLKTHTVSNTAFRGFGGPQGMMVIEDVLDQIAFALGKDPLDVRKINLYGPSPRNATPFGMEVFDNVSPQLFDQIEKTSDYRQRRQDIEQFNRSNSYLKKGLALTGVKFGISFTTTFLNQGGALVHVYTDGSIHLNHGGTEMGQGLNTKVAQIVAQEFEVDLDQVKVTATSTGKVPNTSATAASSGTDINGKAAQRAARTIRRRLVDFAVEHFALGDDSEVRFAAGQVHVGNQAITFPELVNLAYLNRVSLSATGFYRTPKIAYDGETGKGRPFYYFAYGAAVSEVVIDTLTGEHRVLRVDILHDVGRSLNPAIDLGQIEGGFIQGMGWLTSEELVFGKDGQFLTHAPSTYKIPTAGDRPPDFRMQLMENQENAEESVFRSKAVGEPPLMLAISVLRALVDAVRYATDGQCRTLDSPATPERVLLAVENSRRA